MSESVQFVLGDAAGGSLRRQGGPARIVVTRDLFTEGPCRARAPDDSGPGGGERAWLLRRCDWWQRGTTCDERMVAAGRAAVDDLVDALEVLSGEPVVVWVGDALSEQLHLCWLVALLEAHPRAPIPILVARPQPMGGPTDVASVPVGQLAQATRAPLSRADRDLALALWHAFAGPDPHALDDALRTLGAHPLLGSLRWLRHRFPAVSDGLSTWERRLLRRLAAHEGEPLAQTIGHVMGPGRDEGPDLPGDVALFERLLDLGRAGLLQPHGDGQTIRGTRFDVTSAGHDVLAGRVHRAVVGGFDRWIGGVRVRAPDALWSLDGDRIVRLEVPG